METVELTVELAVAQQHLVIGLQAASKLFGQIHRAVFAAGAADGDGYVAAAFLLQFGQATANKGFDVGKHFAGFILGGQIAADKVKFVHGREPEKRENGADYRR